MREASDFVDDDRMTRFSLSGAPVRGCAVRLAATLHQLFAARSYPRPVAAAVAELAVITSLIGQMINPGWKMSIQVRTGGELRLLASDYFAPDSAGVPARLRATATYDENIGLRPALPDWHMMGGYFGVLIDRNDGRQTFQGLVPLEGRTLAGCAEEYFRRSEQIPTRIALAVEQSGHNGTAEWRGGGIIVQKLPEAASGVDDWPRVKTLLETVEGSELTGPSPPVQRTLLRLFHDENPRTEPMQPIEFGCSCSREKVRQGLSIYSAKDIATMMTDAGLVTAECHFCGRAYEFDPASLGFEAVRK
ncbi:MAG: Hsp33 family molecular chaperone HslO [Rhodobacteraceae bacterium]|nr:Hsp33 family molecular chaperone HslO [Paracoccaceae bacterium]